MRVDVVVRHRNADEVAHLVGCPAERGRGIVPVVLELHRAGPAPRGTVARPEVEAPRRPVMPHREQERASLSRMPAGAGKQWLARLSLDPFRA